MDLVSSCGLPVASVVWQSTTGAWALTAMCKATFLLTPGVVTLAQAQEPPNEDDNHWNDDESRSLQSASDLVPFKPRADVLVIGHAFAPHRTNVRSLIARACVGAMDKAVEVWCERWFELDGRVREGAPFLKMPLRYERAAGGADTSNPVGMAFDGAPDGHGRVAIPNVQPLGALVSRRGDTFAPVGFGPLAPHWPDRMARIHLRVPVGWHREWHSRPLAEGINPAFFNAAPSDQQTDFLRPDERIALENLHRDHGHLVTRLPGLQPRAVVERATGHRAPMDLVADTLWIDVDRAICTVVWRGRIGLTHPREQGTIRFTCEEIAGHAAETMPAPAMSSSSSEEEAPGAADSTRTIVPPFEAIARAALPFETCISPPPQRMDPTSAPSVASAPDSGETMIIAGGNDGTDTLPFGKKAAPLPLHAPQMAEPALEPERVSPLDAEATMVPLHSGAKALVLPFGPRATSMEASVLAPVDPALASPPAMPYPNDRLGAMPPAVVPRALTELGAVAIHQAELLADPLAPPPMIGPLATPCMVTQSKALEIESALAPLAPQAAALPATPPEPTIDDYPIERCARIAARLACNPNGADDVLRAEDIDATGWQIVHEHWQGAIRAKVERRNKELLVHYDRAYVSEIEAQRGPVAVDDYARIAEAAERSAQAEVLAMRELPEPVWPYIHRVWIDRMIKDPSLAAQVRHAIATRRAEG